METTTESPNETKKLGKKLAADIAEGLRHKAESKIVALVGDLGAGKTTFVQGFAESLGIKTRIISPTFIIMRKYEIGGKTTGLKALYHLDFYRLEGNWEHEVENLGLAEIWKEEGNIVLIEWAEKIKKFLPKNTIWVNFEVLGDNERKISYEAIH
jgi:tRNA threonylcarbamoyladenosine biosynthesis protein TsaE